MGGVRTCFQCGGEVPDSLRVLRGAECAQCGADLHCCRNCRFHDPSVSNQCSEPQADYVQDKERANFCEFFAIEERSGDRRAGGRGGSGSDAARDAWRRLFKDS